MARGSGAARRRRQWRGIVIGLSTATGVAAGCGGSDDNSAPTYAIESPTPTIMPGSTQQFNVTIDEPVTWGLAESTIPNAEPEYPLKVSADGRYLVDQRDQPWRIQADSAWSISVLATPDEVDQYLTTRRAQGFNSFYLMAMVHPYGPPTYAPNAPDNYEGNPPFAVPGDFSTAGTTPASEHYWEYIDWVIARAAEQDMVVMLAYTYLGWQGGEQGWYSDVLAQPSMDALFNWGVWIGNRYKDDANVVWFGLGDFTPPPGSEGARRVRAIADGIKSAGAQQLFMAEPSPPNEIPGEIPYFGDVVDMNSFYGHGPEGVPTVYETADRAWRLSPPKPAWMQEGTYEFENNTGHYSGEAWDTRRSRFWSVLAGGTAGDGFGSHGVMEWDVPDALSTPGAEYATHTFQLFASMPWWELQPSGTEPGFAGHELVTAGGGTWGELDYVTSALTVDQRWLLAYVPVTEEADGKRTVTVDMSALDGRVRARWFDPATGNYLAISGSEAFENTRTREFTSPGRRGDGTNDWLLVLDASDVAPCGSITVTGTYTAPDVIADGVTCEVTAALQSDASVAARVPLRFGDG